MSTYGYTNDMGERLTISKPFGDVHIHISDGSSASLDVPVNDAPAVALAILEAARVDEHSAAELYAAHFDLRRHVEQEAKLAEREAEDAKVVEFHTAIGANLNRIERHHRDLYRAARKFFAHEEKPAPRVLNCGDPEPGRDSKWDTASGGRLTFDGTYWEATVKTARYGRYTWDYLPALFFPMAEVS